MSIKISGQGVNESKQIRHLAILNKWHPNFKKCFHAFKYVLKYPFHFFKKNDLTLNYMSKDKELCTLDRLFFWVYLYKLSFETVEQFVVFETQTCQQFGNIPSHSDGHLIFNLCISTWLRFQFSFLGTSILIKFLTYDFFSKICPVDVQETTRRFRIDC